MKRLLGVLVVVAVVLLPSLAHSQTTLAGVVRDTSGAVLPGVTVEAGGPALIEKVRSAVTDGSGQYRITDLPPGTYTATFSLIRQYSGGGQDHTHRFALPRSKRNILRSSSRF
jgi:hypothetical protein